MIAFTVKPRILILQSHSTSAPDWVLDCVNTVQRWAELKGYEYILTGDELFYFVPEFGEPFSKIQRSDLARLRLIAGQFFSQCYDAIYWIDADFLIWNIYEFDLPMPTKGSVVCAAEAYIHRDAPPTVQHNNSILGFCCPEDVHQMAVLTHKALRDSREMWINYGVKPCHTIAGPMVLMKLFFPLRKIIVRQAGCFSEETIKKIMGPWVAGRRHIWHLSLISGAELKGANLCSSRHLSHQMMESLVHDLITGRDLELGRWRYISGIYRAWLWLRVFPFRVRCWMQSRIERVWGKP